MCRYIGTPRANSQVELERGRVAWPGRRMRQLCTGTLVHHEQTIRQRSQGTATGARAKAWCLLIHPGASLYSTRQGTAVCGPDSWFGVVTTPGLYYVVSIGYQLEQKGDVDGQGLINTLVPCVFAHVYQRVPSLWVSNF
jgi:hypothetical protein